MLLYFFLDDKDKESVLNYLIECGVNVEKGKNLLEKEKYETMMEVQTKIREKRKRRYLEEKNSSSMRSKTMEWSFRSFYYLFITDAHAIIYSS